MKEQPQGRVIYSSEEIPPEEAVRLLFGTSIRGMIEMFLEEERKKQCVNL